PHTGVNALYAAHIALMGINAIRETFRDEDTVRVHPILTHGGSQVNVIPGEARLETYVRGRTLEAIREANTRVDRALRAGALALARAAGVADPLWDGAGRGREVVATAKPALSRDAYVKFQRDIRKREVYHGTTITAAASPR